MRVAVADGTRSEEDSREQRLCLTNTTVRFDAAGLPYEKVRMQALLLGVFGLSKIVGNNGCVCKIFRSYVLMQCVVAFAFGDDYVSSVC